MKKPPPTPEAQLMRILRIAKLNGMSVVIIAGIGILISIGDWLGMAVGAAIFYGGWLELKGRKQLLAGDASGVRRLVQSQLVVLAAIEIYCLMKLGFDHDHGVSQEMRELMTEAGLDVASLEPSLRMAFYATYIAVGLVTFVYQGGMARYYGSKAAVVRAALEDRARPPTPGAGRAAPEDEVT